MARIYRNRRGGGLSASQQSQRRIDSYGFQQQRSLERQRFQQQESLLQRRNQMQQQRMQQQYQQKRSLAQERFQRQAALQQRQFQRQQALRRRQQAQKRAIAKKHQERQQELRQTIGREQLELEFDKAEKQAELQQERYEENRDNAISAFRDQRAGMVSQALEEVDAINEKVQQTRRQRLQAQGQADVSAAEGGIAGTSVDAVESGTDLRAAENVRNLDRRERLTFRQVNDELKGLRAQRDSRINSVREGEFPSENEFQRRLKIFKLGNRLQESEDDLQRALM